MRILIAFIICASSLCSAYANISSERVKSYLRMIVAGKVDDVKRVLPDLLAEYPDDPGILLLHGAVIDDAYKAVEIFDKLVKRYPDSEWTDDAYWRIVQFYAVTGDTARASQELENYRKKCPTSEYLMPASDVVRTAVAVVRAETRMNNIYSLNEDSPAKTKKQTKDVPKDNIAPAVKEPVKEVKETREVKEPKANAEVKKNESQEPKKEEPKTKVIDEDAKERWGLQIGIYSSEDAAENEKEKFAQKRLHTEIITKKVDGALMYAVVIGNYSSKESAEMSKPGIQSQCGCSPIIYKK